MTNYQKRMTKFVWVGGMYGVCGAAAILYYELPNTAWLVLASTVCINYLLAAGFDAVYDSLNETLAAMVDRDRSQW